MKNIKYDLGTELHDLKNDAYIQNLAEWAYQKRSANSAVKPQSSVGRTRPPKPIWSATDGSTPAQSAFKQYRRYAADFSDVTNTKQYIEKAKSFFRKPPEGTLRLTGKGKIFLYHMASETFGMYEKNGIPIEFYKLNIFRHKYSSNLEFFYYAPDQ